MDIPKYRKAKSLEKGKRHSKGMPICLCGSAVAFPSIIMYTMKKDAIRHLTPSQEVFLDRHNFFFA